LDRTNKNDKDKISESEYLNHTNLNPDDFEMIDEEDNHSTHLEHPKKKQ
jgi:hypothetical protein